MHYVLCMYLCVCVFVRTRVCMYVCIYVCMYCKLATRTTASNFIKYEVLFICRETLYSKPVGAVNITKLWPCSTALFNTQSNPTACNSTIPFATPNMLHFELPFHHSGPVTTCRPSVQSLRKLKSRVLEWSCSSTYTFVCSIELQPARSRSMQSTDISSFKPLNKVRLSQNRFSLTFRLLDNYY